MDEYEKFAELRARHDERVERGVQEGVADWAFELEHRVHTADRNLLDAAVALQRQLARVVQALADGRHVNSQGELQGDAAKFDVLCALRQQAHLDAATFVRHVVGEREEVQVQ